MLAITTPRKENRIMKDWIKDIQDNGKLIILSNGSKYKVSSYDTYDTKYWMKLDNVSVSENKMTNHNQRDKTINVIKIL
jgi:hypothetical protein